METSAVVVFARIQNFVDNDDDGHRQNYVDNDDSSTLQVPAGSVKSLAEVTAALDLKVKRILYYPTPGFNQLQWRP